MPGVFRLPGFIHPHLTGNMSRFQPQSNTLCSVGSRSAGMCVSYAGVLHKLHTGCVSIGGSSVFSQKRTVVTRGAETFAPLPELDCPAATTRPPIRCGVDRNGRFLRFGALHEGQRGRVHFIHSLAGAARREIRTSHRVVGGDTLAAPAFSTSGIQPGIHIPKNYAPVEYGPQRWLHNFRVGVAGPINLRPVFSTSCQASDDEAPRRGLSGDFSAPLDRGAFPSGAEREQSACSHRQRVTTSDGSAPFISTPGTASDDEAPRRGSSGDGSRCDNSNAPIPRIASVQNGVIFHNLKFRLVIDPTCGPAATSHPAAGLRPSQSLTSVHGAEPVSNSPSSELWTSASTVPGAGFLGFTSSAVCGAYDIRTDAAISLDSSNCVKLRFTAASVLLSPAAYPANTAGRRPVKHPSDRACAGDFSTWTHGVVLRSGKFCDATLRCCVHLFETNASALPVVCFFYTDRNAASVSFRTFWQGVFGASQGVPGRLFLCMERLSGPIHPAFGRSVQIPILEYISLLRFLLPQRKIPFRCHDNPHTKHPLPKNALPMHKEIT